MPALWPFVALLYFRVEGLEIEGSLPGQCLLKHSRYYSWQILYQQP
jgi:hypothetical protein